jgi:hypothetical protein
VKAAERDAKARERVIQFPTGPVVDLGAPKPPPAATLRFVDLRVEGSLADGSTRFFAGKDGEWGKFGKARDLLGVTVLVNPDRRGVTWAPLVGASVVLRFKPDFVAIDAYTRGDGTTIPLPVRVVQVPTIFGLFLHCPILPDQEFRIEVAAKGLASALVCVILHTLEADVEEKKA